ncbi:thioredoxin F1, chloroplastic [Carica papaya]|uniref:thioredoxin F1, chloroplastic n=1 Tax=Carica papaya TaxID=3649 RepID=UPI000B8CD60D|nr:thioredoxin F1, chloroplastic [Carica papaya]
MPLSLHLSSSPSAICCPPSPASAVNHLIFFSGLPTTRLCSKSLHASSRKRSRAVCCSLDVVGPTVGQVIEVNKDTFWPIVEAAGEKTVVVDMYTQWCGPCKVMAPKFQELSEKYLDVVFLKLDCNQENKPLAKELGIRVVPTFKILKHNKIVKEVTGAKFDDLVLAIETVRSS